MGELSREEFLVHMDLVRKDISGVHDRLDVLNGRTRRNEQDIAVLNDRAREEPNEDTGTRRRRGTKASLVGAGAAGAIYGVIEVLRWLKG